MAPSWEPFLVAICRGALLLTARIYGSQICSTFFVHRGRGYYSLRRDCRVVLHPADGRQHGFVLRDGVFTVDVPGAVSTFVGWINAGNTRKLQHGRSPTRVPAEPEAHKNTPKPLRNLLVPSFSG